MLRSFASVSFFLWHVLCNALVISAPAKRHADGVAVGVRHKRTIFGDDDRRPISASEAHYHPFGASVFVFTSGRNCSGTLLSPLHVLTAAHCVPALPSPGGYANATDSDKIRVELLHRCYGRRRYDVRAVHLPKEWTQLSSSGDSTGYDFALLTLDRCATQLSSYLKMADEVPFPGMQLNMASFAGYSSTGLWYSHCPAEEVGENLIYQECDAVPGSDGAGMFTYTDVARINRFRRRLVAVFSGSQWRFGVWKKKTLRNFNAAVTLTNTTQAIICDWVKGLCDLPDWKDLAHTSLRSIPTLKNGTHFAKCMRKTKRRLRKDSQSGKC